MMIAETFWMVPKALPQSAPILCPRGDVGKRAFTGIDPLLGADHVGYRLGDGLALLFDA